MAVLAAVLVQRAGGRLALTQRKAWCRWLLHVRPRLRRRRGGPGPWRRLQPGRFTQAAMGLGQVSSPVDANPKNAQLTSQPLSAQKTQPCIVGEASHDCMKLTFKLAHLRLLSVAEGLRRGGRSGVAAAAAVAARQASRRKVRVGDSAARRHAGPFALSRPVPPPWTFLSAPGQPATHTALWREGQVQEPDPMQHFELGDIENVLKRGALQPAWCLRQDRERAVCRGILLADWLLRHSVGSCMDAAALDKTQVGPHTDCGGTRCIL